MRLIHILSGLNRGWAIFAVIVAASGIGGGAYAAWTASLHVEGTIQTGDVDVVWDMQEDRKLVGILDPATGQIVNSPVPAEKDVAECISSLEPGTVDRTVNFQVSNAYPSFTCEITLGALVTGSVPVHISDITQEFLDAAGNPVLNTEIETSVQFTRKIDLGDGEFLCDLEQPINVGLQLHRGDRFCTIIRVHATEAAQQNQSYTGAIWIDVIQWNFSGDVVIPPNNPPVAVDDTFTALGNTELLVGVAPGGSPATQLSGSVLDNDSDPDSDPLSVVPFSGPTANNGFVTLTLLGRFSYLPPQGFNGADTFPYALDDGNGGTANGLVTINVSDMVWYVDSGGSASGDGTSLNPFESLLPLTTGGIVDPLDNPGDTIFVHQGVGLTPGGIVLEPNQRLIGQGVALSVPPFLPNPLVPAAGPPTIFASTGDAIVLSSGNTVRGLSVRSSAGDGIVGTGVGALTINSIPFIDSVGGSGVAISGATAGAVLVDRVAVNNPAGDGINLSNSSATFTFVNLDVTNSGGTGLRANNAGNLRIGGGATPSVINSTNGVGLDVTNTTIDPGGLAFESISSNGAANGIVLNNTGSSGGLTITGNTGPGSGGTIQNTTGDGISLVSTELIALSLMSIGPTDGSGISGTSVSGFNGSRLMLSNIGSSAGEHGISFDGLTGANTIRQTTIINAADHNLRVVNTGGTMSSLVVSDSVFRGGAGSIHGGSGVFVELSGAAVVSNLEIGAGTPATDDADSTQFHDMDGFGIDLHGSLSGGTFTNVVIDDVQVLRAGAGGVLLATNANAPGGGGGIFSLTNSEIEGDNSAAIGVGADGQSAAVVTIRNNTARVINRGFFGVSVVGVRADGNVPGDIPDLRVTIDGNTVSGGDAFGINATSRGSAGSLDARIVNNVISDTGDDGVRVRAGNGTGGETDTVRVYLEGNDATLNVLGDGFDLRDQSNPTTFQIGCDGTAHTECSALIAGPGGVDDQGVLALHGNTGTTTFIGITDPPVFEIVNMTAVLAP